MKRELRGKAIQEVLSLYLVVTCCQAGKSAPPDNACKHRSPPSAVPKAIELTVCLFCRY